MLVFYQSFHKSEFSLTYKKGYTMFIIDEKWRTEYKRQRRLGLLNQFVAFVKESFDLPSEWGEKEVGDFLLMDDFKRKVWLAARETNK